MERVWTIAGLLGTTLVVSVSCLYCKRCKPLPRPDAPGTEPPPPHEVSTATHGRAIGNVFTAHLII